MTRLEFPGAIDGRVRHAHHHDGTHGCVDHFHLERHREECYHRHDGVVHLIDIDAECGVVRDEKGAVTAIRG